jgi:glycosyltransferase involved in cell wall biosynthesis
VRIAVNLLFCVPGVVGGSEEYAVRTLLAFAAYRPPDVEPTLFAPPALLAAHPDLAAAYPTVAAPVSGRSKPLRVLAESTWLAARVRRGGFDLCHHVGGRMPAVRPVPGLVTVHDLQPLRTPERFGPVKRRFIRWSLPRSARAAVGVVAVSDVVAADVVALLGVPAARVATVSSCYEAPAAPGPPPGPVAERLARGRRLLVYPAITHPHKGHLVLLDAMARVAAGRPDVDLVLTGGAGLAEDEVARAAAGLGDRVLRLGRVSRAELDATVAAAEALVFPSSFEGFGIPVLEAMALGVPVICSDIPPLREVAGDAAGTAVRLVPAADAGAWAAAIEERLLGRPDRDTAAGAGRRRAAVFSPAATAARLEAAYRAAHRVAHPDAPQAR